MRGKLVPWEFYDSFISKRRRVHRIFMTGGYRSLVLLNGRFGSLDDSGEFLALEEMFKYQIQNPISTVIWFGGSR